MKIMSGIKILLVALVLAGIAGTGAALSLSNSEDGKVQTISIVTDSSWKSLDAKVKGWTSIDLDDSYWENAEVLDIELSEKGFEKANVIWYPGYPMPGTSYFRKNITLNGKVVAGRMVVHENTYIGAYLKNIYVNDNLIRTRAPGHWGSSIQELDITPYLREGKNIIAVEGDSRPYWAIIATIRVASTPTLTPTPEFTSTVSDTSPMPSGQPSKSASVSREKTDVVLGEDILLKLSAVNLITKPKMHVQVIIIPPSGMSVTSSEFVQSGAGQFTTTYELEPGKGRDIEVRIRSNQVGDFNVNGRIVYYFGDEKDKAEDHTLNLPIKVRKEIASTPAQNPTAAPAQKSTLGFELIIGISALLLAVILKRRCYK